MQWRGRVIDADVFAGNTSDVRVYRECIKANVDKYGIKELILIGDWAMIPTVEQKRLMEEKVKFIGRVKLSEVRKLERRGVVKLDLWDRKIQEVVDEGGNRLILVLSPFRREREWKTLIRNLTRLHNELKAVYVKVRSDKLRDKRDIERAVWERLGTRRPYKNFFVIEVGDCKFDYRLNREVMAEKVKYLGVWGLRTNVEKEEMDEEKAVETYKSLFNVERSFRYLKTTLLRVRPIYHRLSDRIVAHVRICLMALNLSRGLISSWNHLFDKYNCSGKDWNITCERTLDLLDRIYIVKYSASDKPVVFVNNDDSDNGKVLNELLKSLPFGILEI